MACWFLAADHQSWLTASQWSDCLHNQILDKNNWKWNHPPKNTVQITEPRPVIKVLNGIISLNNSDPRCPGRINCEVIHLHDTRMFTCYVFCMFVCIRSSWLDMKLGFGILLLVRLILLPRNGAAVYMCFRDQFTALSRASDRCWAFVPRTSLLLFNYSS